MGGRFHDREHFVRLLGLFAAGFVVFLIARAVLVPKGFGEYGHYRAGALADVASRPITFAGRAACADCHSDVADLKKAGKHAGLGCEACHGPLAAHAADPTTAKAAKPVPSTLCPVCHTKNVAKPSKFPQVDPKEHASGASCSECHKPHSPGIS